MCWGAFALPNHDEAGAVMIANEVVVEDRSIRVIIKESGPYPGAAPPDEPARERTGGAGASARNHRAAAYSGRRPLAAETGGLSAALILRIDVFTSLQGMVVRLPRGYVDCCTR
jgi:hypothetical protein